MQRMLNLALFCEYLPSLFKKWQFTIYVRFKIDQKGNIVDIGSRGPHPRLESEAERVIKLLPQMTPGKQRGKAVGVLYSLPIVFQVQD